MGGRKRGRSPEAAPAPAGALKKSKQVTTIEEDWVKQLFKQRHKVALKKLELDLLKLDNQVRFVQGILEKKIYWWNTKAEWGLELKEKGFTPFPKNTKVIAEAMVIAEATGGAVDEEDFQGAAGDYDYILNMPARTFTTLDGRQKLREERDRLKGALDEWRKATPMSFWTKDLDVLVKALFGEVEKDSSESICLSVNVNGKDIVEPKKVAITEDSVDSSGDDETSSEDDPKVSAGKDSAAGKQKVKIEEPIRDLSSEDNDDSSEGDPKMARRALSIWKHPILQNGLERLLQISENSRPQICKRQVFNN